MDKFPKEYQKLVDDSYPDVISRNDFKNFSTIEPRELPAGTKIYRIVDEGTSELTEGVSGCYWAYKLPKSKTEWRRQYAVKDSWNDNGYYIEYEVPQGRTLKVWEGKVAGQWYEVYDGKKFYLEGNGIQLYVKYALIKNPQMKQTNWEDALK